MSRAERKAYSHPLSKCCMSMGFQKSPETPSAKSLSLLEMYLARNKFPNIGCFH